MTDLVGQYLGRYYLAERLGEGGMATVYKAFDTRLERDVAVKIIRRDAFPANALDQVLKRFEREAKSLAKLSHPNIVKVYDYGEHDGAPYLVMEYLPGGTLKARLGKPVPWGDAVRLLLPVARGVAYAHARGILHRDIKPANILITESGEPMLSDFGIAKILEAEQTTALTGLGMGIGTPEYMAPEQWSGDTSPKSDLYSLGIVLYEMVAGRKPYVADTPAAIHLKQATEPLPSPRKFASGVPEDLELVLIKALAKEPADRHESLDAFAGALEGLHGRAAVPMPPPPGPGEETYRVPLPEPEVPVPPPAPSPPGSPPSANLSRKGIAALVGGIVLVLLVVLAAPSIKTWLSPGAPAAETASASTTAPVAPISDEITDPKGVPMRLVPAGEFNMGSADGDSDERPVHAVYLDAFYMDTYEVTNALYRACVTGGGCTPPQRTGSYTRSLYYGDPEFDEYPVMYVDWNQAAAYCRWQGASLPSEAQWEKAARGTDGRTYPWGEGIDCSKANYCEDDTVKVGSYESGRSPYGIYDLAGNVWEWTADWYSQTYYQDSPASDPLGPDSGTARVLRGGAWNYHDSGLRASYRYRYTPWYPPGPTIEINIGFRCVRGTAPGAPTETNPPEPSATPAEALTPTAAELADEITDPEGVPMRLVSAGEFNMGSDDGDSDERPVHAVYLDAFYMDTYEVTNALYRACVTGGGCTPPQRTSSNTRATYYGNPEFDDYPVIYVDWAQAAAYCGWRDASLPSEAQWEKAARGTDGRTYPWGEGIDCSKANYCEGDTVRVGSYESGRSPYGIHDLAGNVWEWTADWYSETYYQDSPTSDPQGPDSGEYRVLRGGAWNNLGGIVLRASKRFWSAPGYIYLSIGFRCVRSLP